ncbi:MAG TPA: ATP-binding protein [Candidatus Acidoferrales bacterium]|nr:ATP-binding protein [Candidatus Acidoferrales bacterium]
MKHPESRHRIPLILGGVCLSLLLAAAFTFGSLDVPFEPKSWRDVLTLYAVSTVITAALLVLGLVLTRTALRLWIERRKDQPGTRFKSKMVVGAMAISLLPILFMFFVSYSLLNRTLLRWFPRPLEIASEQTEKLLNDLGRTQIQRLQAAAAQALAALPKGTEPFTKAGVAAGADGVWLLGKDGDVHEGGVACEASASPGPADGCLRQEHNLRQLRVLSSGVELWQAGRTMFFASRVPVVDAGQTVGYVLAGFRANPDFLARYDEIQSQTTQYYAQKQNLRTLKRQMLLILLLFTALALFAVTWVALFLAKQVTVPIQALVEGTREVSAGNFEYQVPEQAQDELALLVRSFNSMTGQLRDSRSQIDQFTRNLQQAVQELERRRQLMETILESIPTSVLSLDPSGAILRANSAVSHMFGLEKLEPKNLEDLLGADVSRMIQQLMRRSLRIGVVSREVETVVAGRVLHLAVTVSSLGPRRANTGYVLVLDDLTELLRAQKSAAWQEVARRIAHEIKNPLTPIQLSAQRLSRFLERRSSDPAAQDSELTRLVEECSRLIEREVSTLASLVNEFSQFVRFPTAKLSPANPTLIVQEALEVFSGRLDGIAVRTFLSDSLPAVRADHALLRSVIVNLIDNAAEALEGAHVREITVSTRAQGDSDSVEISVADTGHGISPEDKDKLFLPHFSTKGRGTGLGLAIAARIITEHGGIIYAEDNFPVGARFIVVLPAAEVASTPAATGTAEAPR